jgi:chaperonin GroES
MFRASFVARKSLQPLGERVLVKRMAAAKETKSGILIPEQVAGKVNEATVVAVAPENKDWKPTVKVGDIVLLPDFGGNSVKLDGVEYHLYEEGSLLGVIGK